MTKSIASQFTPARESVQWARDALAEFQDIGKAFLGNDVAKIVTDFDSKTGEHVQKLILTKALPHVLRRKITEALITARHAFDQATFAARNITSGFKAKGVNYPWSSNPTDMERLLKCRGVDERLWQTFADQQPYGTSDGHIGGNDVIRTLATMANSKHTVGLTLHPDITNIGHPNITGHVTQRLEIFMPRWDAVKNEAELMRWIGDVEIDGQYNVGFEIRFKDSRLSEPVNAVMGTRAFIKMADDLVESLHARCEEIAP